MTGRGLVGGDPPGPAALDGAEPDIVLGDEGDEILMQVRETEISG
jgi:hypothetical protein